MLTEQNHQLIAYLATLGALIVVLVASLVTAAIAPAILGKFETFGLGTITGGLIGVLRLPQQRTVKIDNTKADPVPTEEAST